VLLDIQVIKRKNVALSLMYIGSGCTSPPFLHADTSWKFVISLAFKCLYKNTLHPRKNCWHPLNRSLA